MSAANAVKKPFGIRLRERIRDRDTAIYGVLLIIAAVVGVFQAGHALWRGIAGGTPGSSGIVALDQLLLVLMMVEILHTVRISDAGFSVIAQVKLCRLRVRSTTRFTCVCPPSWG